MNNEEVDVVSELPQINFQKYSVQRSISKQFDEVDDTVVDIKETITAFHPPDGGYGWVVVAACFMSLATSEGFIYSYGSLFLDLVETFDATNFSVMIGGFLMIGFASITGPFAASIANKFGFKTTLASGAVIVSFSICVSSVCQSIISFSIVLGVMGGMSFGLILLSAYTVPNLWFERKRPMATSLTLGGGGFGVMVYPFLIDFLLNKYGLRGSLMILGAISLNNIVLALVIKEPYAIIQASNQSDARSRKSTCLSQELFPLVSQQFIFSKQSIASYSTLDRKGIIFSNHSISKRSLNPPSEYLSSVLDEIPNHLSVTNVAVVPDNETDIIQGDIPCVEESALREIMKKVVGDDTSPSRPKCLEENFFTSLGTVHSQVTFDDINRVRESISKEISRPFVRQDIFLINSTINMDSKSNPRDSQSTIYSKPMKNIRLTKTDVTSPLAAILKRIFQLDLLKKPVFYIVALSTLLVATTTLSTPQTMVDYSNSIGLSSSQSSIFSLGYGCALLISKPILGAMMNYVRHSEISYIVSIVLLTIMTSVVGFVPNASFIIFYGVLLGLTSSNMSNMRCQIISEYIPQDRITAMFGWAFLMNGFSMMVAPIIVLLGTNFASYSISFIINSILLLFAAIVLGMLFIIRKKK